MHGADEHFRGKHVGSDAASWAKMILEQDLELDELVEDQPRARGAKRVQWASIATHRRCRMDWCWATPSSKPLTVVWRHAGRPIFVRKLGNTSAADVLRREHDHGQRVWWKANAIHPWRSSDAVPPSSERSAGDSWSREGEAFPPTLSAAGTSFGWRRQMRKAQSRYEYNRQRRQDRSWAREQQPEKQQLI